MTSNTAANSKADADHCPASNSEYLSPGYWDARYKGEEHYEWFKGYAEFRHLVSPYLRPEDRILILGCGNSSMSADLYREGFRRQTNIDISPVVVAKMRAKAEAAGMQGLEWRQADMLDLPFANGSFDVVLEKGTVDVLFVDNDSPWTPKPEVKERVHKMLCETHRVLQQRGTFLSITFAQPHFRKPFLQAAPFTWSVDTGTVGETFHYFVYRMSKGCCSGERICEQLGAQLEHFMRDGTVHDHMDNEDYLLAIDI